jgi:hypothetical protein
MKEVVEGFLRLLYIIRVKCCQFLVTQVAQDHVANNGWCLAQTVQFLAPEPGGFLISLFSKIQAITHTKVQIQHPISLVLLTTTGTFIRCGRWSSISANLLLDPQCTISSDIFFQPPFSNEFLVVTGVEQIFLDALGNIDLHVHISSCILITDSVPSKYLVQFIGRNPFVSNLSSEDRAEDFRDLNFLLSAHIHCGQIVEAHRNRIPRHGTVILDQRSAHLC